MKQLITHYFANKSAKYNEVLVKDGKLTEKGQKVVETYSKLSKLENNEAVITLKDTGRVFGTTEYSVISGNLYELINFSPEVTMTKDAASGHLWAVSEKEISVDETKLVSPKALNDLIDEWVLAQNGLTVVQKPLSKERKTLGDFKFLYKDAKNFYQVGAPTAGGVNENVVFFREVTFKHQVMGELYPTFNHYTVESERLNWILG